MSYRIYGILLIMGTLNHGNYGIFLIVGNAGFISSTVIMNLMLGSPKPIQAREVREVLGGHPLNPKPYKP